MQTSQFLQVPEGTQKVRLMHMGSRKNGKELLHRVAFLSSFHFSVRD